MISKSGIVGLKISCDADTLARGTEADLKDKKTFSRFSPNFQKYFPIFEEIYNVYLVNSQFSTGLNSSLMQIQVSVEEIKILPRF